MSLYLKKTQKEMILWAMFLLMMIGACIIAYYDRLPAGERPYNERTHITDPF
jgi:uncharacterized membrane-anchored protein